MTYTLHDIQAQLYKLVQDQGSFTKAAKRIGVSVPYLYDIVHGKRFPGPTILNYLGMEKMVSVTYRDRAEPSSERTAK